MLFESSVGGFPEKLAGVAALLTAPIVLLAKMEKAKEFEQIAVFRATMRAMAVRETANSSFLYYWWTAIFVLRAYWVLPYMIVANAVVVGSTTSGERSCSAPSG